VSAQEWREQWRTLAACKGADTRIFFPERGGDYATAKAICAECPVRQACLEDALETGELHGIRGGRSERERRRMRGERRRKVTQCGTTSGYKAHNRRGEPPCSQCRQANAQYHARWKAERAS